MGWYGVAYLPAMVLIRGLRMTGTMIQTMAMGWYGGMEVPSLRAVRYRGHALR